MANTNDPRNGDEQAQGMGKEPSDPPVATSRDGASPDASSDGKAPADSAGTATGAPVDLVSEGRKAIEALGFAPVDDDKIGEPERRLFRVVGGLDDDSRTRLFRRLRSVNSAVGIRRTPSRM